MRLATHWTLEELIKSDTAIRLDINNTPTEGSCRNLQELVTLILEPLRQEWGAPIVCSSGYRCKDLNISVGGVSTSDHRFGCAADIHALSNTREDNKRLFDTAVEAMKTGKIKRVKQIIDEHDYAWIHISYQDGRTTKHNQVLHL